MVARNHGGRLQISLPRFVSGALPSVPGMEKLAPVTALRTRECAPTESTEQVHPTPEQAAYWRRVQALRAELAGIQEAG